MNTPPVPATAPWCQAADAATRKPQITLPALACDCHAHICGPFGAFPYAEERIYTPPDALLADYRRMLGTLGVQRAVLVQPSVYGTDNSVLIKALREAGTMMRGVAVVDPTILDADLRALDDAGVRGVRINVVDRREGLNTVPLDEIVPLAKRIADLGWHVELLLQVDAAVDLETVIAAIPTDIVLGHFGYAHVARGGAEHPGFKTLLRVMQTGRCWVKMTGPYRISAQTLPYADIMPMVHALVQNAPERLVWGTDWPHVMIKGPMPNDGDLCDRLMDWLPDPGTRQRVVVENPAAL